MKPWWNPMKSPLNPMKPPLNPMKSPLNPMKSSWNHHEITQFLKHLHALEEHDLANDMAKAWYRFAAFGHPGALDSGANWAPQTESTAPVMKFQAHNGSPWVPVEIPLGSPWVPLRSPWVPEEHPDWPWSFGWVSVQIRDFLLPKWQILPWFGLWKMSFYSGSMLTWFKQEKWSQIWI